MVSTRNPHRNRSRSKAKRVRSSKGRQNEKRLVVKRLSKLTQNNVQANVHDMASIRRDEEQSRDRKIQYDEFGFGVSEKDRDPSSINDKLKEIENDRARVYGDPFLSHQAIGLVWEGIFRNRYHEFVDEYNHVGPIGKLFPADLVAEMLAGFKLARLARPVYHQDSADDAHNYLNFTERFRSKK